MQPLFPTLALLSDMLFGVVGAVAATVVSFTIITLIASYYRFQHIVEKAEDTQPEEMGTTAIDILRVQLARYLAGCARRNTSFSIALIQPKHLAGEVRMGIPLIQTIKQAARCDDVVCVYDENTIALLQEVESEDTEAILKRIADAIIFDVPGIGAEALRVGIASYPGHGLSGKVLLDVAHDGLTQATDECPIVFPEIEEEDEEDDGEEEIPEEEVSQERHRGRRKQSMLDDLTGVLKPSVISAYMQRMMSDLRYKKKKAALFCIGVNKMEHIERFHGAEAVDDVLAGVSRILQENLRATDLIGRHEKYAFLVLAEASLEHAEIIGKRISTLIQQNQISSGRKKIKVTITLGVAAYPEHGRNLHTLYKAGQQVLDYSRNNDIRAYAVYDPKIHASMPSKPMKSIKSIQA